MKTQNIIIQPLLPLPVVLHDKLSVLDQNNHKNLSSLVSHEVIDLIVLY